MDGIDLEAIFEHKTYKFCISVADTRSGFKYTCWAIGRGTVLELQKGQDLNVGHNEQAIKQAISSACTFIDENLEDLVPWLEKLKPISKNFKAP